MCSLPSNHVNSISSILLCVEGSGGHLLESTGGSMVLVEEDTVRCDEGDENREDEGDDENHGHVMKFCAGWEGDWCAFPSSPQPKERKHRDAHMTFPRGFGVSKNLLHRLGVHTHEPSGCSSSQLL
ncbi:hypothetical protein K439DRAFT_1624464 [Ramaria rubella]|nr:hypothetical protein K439DRAFT_1624464 [Ramaria rubella]